MNSIEQSYGMLCRLARDVGTGLFTTVYAGATRFQLKVHPHKMGRRSMEKTLSHILPPTKKNTKNLMIPCCNIFYIW